MVGSDALEKFARALPATGPDGEGLQATERGAPSPSLQNLLCRVEGPRDLSAGRLGRKLVGSVQQAQAHQPGTPTREGPTNSRDSDGSPRLDPVTSTNRAPTHYISQLLDGCVTRAAAVRTHVSPPRPVARPKTGVKIVRQIPKNLTTLAHRAMGHGVSISENSRQVFQAGRLFSFGVWLRGLLGSPHCRQAPTKRGKGQLRNRSACERTPDRRKGHARPLAKVVAAFHLERFREELSQRRGKRFVASHGRAFRVGN